MTFDLGALIQGKLFAFLLIFCRVGALLMALPGIGETFMPQRIRLQLALLMSFILLPFLEPMLPAMPQSVAKISELIILELGSGLFIGLVLRMLTTTLETAGQLIALQIGLSSAQILNPTLASQGSLPSAMLSLLGLVVIFESGLLDMMLQSVVQSYHLFKPGVWWMIGDMTEFYSHTINESFALALRLIAPFMILGIVFQVTGGLMVKLIPQMQVFYVLAPLEILVGLVLFGLTLSVIMTLWAHGFEESFLRLFHGGA